MVVALGGYAALLPGLLAPVPGECYGDEAPEPPSRPRGRARPHSYRLRSDLGIPECLAREEMPRSADDLHRCIADRIVLGDWALAVLSRKFGRMLVSEYGVFSEELKRYEARFELSDDRIMQGGQRAFSFNDSLDERRLLPLLAARMKRDIDRAGLESLSDGEVRRGIMLLLSIRPELLSDACRECLAANVQVRQSEPIPRFYTSPLAAAPAARSAYGVFPVQLNREERAFAELIDGDTGGIVLWWLRNVENARWAVSIVMPTGRRHYPDFVIGVDGRKIDDGVALVEVKDDGMTGRAYSDRNADKTRTDHRVYGSALMVARDPQRREWLRYAWVSAIRRHQPAESFRLEDLVWTR